MLAQLATTFPNAKNPQARFNLIDWRRPNDLPAWRLEELVEEAIVNDDVWLAYQPVRLVASLSRVLYFEGFLRIFHAGEEMLFHAGQVFPRLEDTELARRLDCIALKKALDLLAAVPSLRVGINASTRSIGHSEWKRILVTELSKKPSIGRNLFIEFPEQSVIQFSEVVGSFVREFRPLGVSFAVDGFANGPTDLNIISEIGFEVVKSRFWSNHYRNSYADSDLCLIAAREIAKTFDAVFVVTGVEDAAQSQKLRDFNIPCVQGQFFDHPLETRDLVASL